MGVVRTAALVVVWEFIVVIVFLVLNTFLFGHAIPIFDDIANQIMTSEGYALYEQRAIPIKAGILVAFFIMVITPFLYIFVRLILKKEQTAPQVYMQQY